MTALENLIIYYNQLPLGDGKREILRRLLPNVTKLEQMNIYQLAQLCYTSPASVSRLVKQLGYKSYAEFQIRLTESVQRYDYDNRFTLHQRGSQSDPSELVADAISLLVEEFRRNADMEQIQVLTDTLHNAHSVAIFSYGIRFMESTLQSDLLFSGIPCDVVLEDNVQMRYAALLEPGDTALFICPDAVDSISALSRTVHIAHERGCRIIILSSTGHQPFLHEADHVLSFNGSHSMSDSFYLEMELALIDMVYRAKYIDGERA